MLTAATDLWLVVRLATGERLSIGPWPSAERRAEAAAKWRRYAGTVETELVAGRPRGGLVLAPLVGRAGLVQVARRRRGVGVVSDDAIAARYLEGLSIRQVAAELEIGVATVNRALHRAGVELRPPYLSRGRAA